MLGTEPGQALKRFVALNTAPRQTLDKHTKAIIYYVPEVAPVVSGPDYSVTDRSRVLCWVFCEIPADSFIWEEKRLSIFIFW